MTNSFKPGPENRFIFGLWTMGNIGRDPFGEAVREALSLVEKEHLLGVR